MKKLTIGIYATGGIVICLLALIEFGLNNDRTNKQVMMLVGLLILGLMYVGAAVGTAFSKSQQHPAVTNAKARPRLVWALTALALLLASVMIGWGLSLHPVQLHDVAIAVVLLTVPIANCVDAFVVTRHA
ncbi:hypothetical protein ACFQ3L_06655 [Lacticaseibacillus jixianensis]|uniref:DUF2178 domain-containing protein n=1 Tax=Lacticaseibacillus jixianensis TaxID=2486012 RepID=A0ABW4BAG3_9LACO|nr:hypothetical protein [Lacticaseibacillus jixianensis]